MPKLKLLIMRADMGFLGLVAKRVGYLSVISLAGRYSAGEERGAANIRAINHTAGAINWMSVNGYGVDGGGGSSCCTGMSLKWRPGLTAEVEWEVDSEPFAKIKRSSTGAGFDKDAWVAHVSNYRRVKKVVDIPAWPERKICDFKVHFLTCDRVVVMTVCLLTSHPNYLINVAYGVEGSAICLH